MPESVCMCDKSVVTVNIPATDGLQQILFIPHITGTLWALGYLEDGQQFGEEGFEYR